MYPLLKYPVLVWQIHHINSYNIYKNSAWDWHIIKPFSTPTRKTIKTHVAIRCRCECLSVWTAQGVNELGGCLGFPNFCAPLKEGRKEGRGFRDGRLFCLGIDVCLFLLSSEDFCWFSEFKDQPFSIENQDGFFCPFLPGKIKIQVASSWPRWEWFQHLRPGKFGKIKVDPPHRSIHGDRRQPKNNTRMGFAKKRIARAYLAMFFVDLSVFSRELVVRNEKMSW